MIGKRIQIREITGAKEETFLNLRCKVERNGVKIKTFRKPISLTVVSAELNLPKPQEPGDMEISLENIRKGQISLGLFNRQMSFITSNYKVCRKVKIESRFLKLFSLSFLLIVICSK